WTWDGTNWTQPFPAATPGARFSATMAYDTSSGSMVLFGGAVTGPSGPVQVGDTWTWDGTNWTGLSPAASPPAREFASMDYDPATGNMVLFGGFGSSGNLGDTWMYAPASVPDAPTLTKVAGANGAIALTWGDPTENGGSVITGYDLYCALGTPNTSGTPNQTVSGATATTGTVSGLMAGDTYNCVVTAVNSVGQSPASNQLSAAVSAASKIALSLVPPSVPGGPFGVTATVANASTNPLLPTPTGTVRFSIAGVTCAGGSTVTLAGGTATCSFVASSGFQVRVTYSGDAVYGASSASAVMGTSSLSSPVAIWLSSHGEWTLEAQLSSAGTGPGGDSVTFEAGTTLLCSATTNASGVASCQVAPSAAAAAWTSFVATFAGDTLLLGTTSAPGTLPAP
ncbi:MAG: Ig-like domain repeat protein, partial [Acidimicrobiales bacterium]